MGSCINGRNLVNLKSGIVKILNEKPFKEKKSYLIKSYPCARWKHATVVYQNYLYVMGGCSWITVLKDLWSLSLKAFNEAVQDQLAIHDFWNTFDICEDMLWKDLSNFIGHIPPLQSHTMVAYDNQLYIFGGSFVYDVRDCPLWIYSLEFQMIRKWKVKDTSELPTPRRNHSCSIYSNTMLVFGGFGDIRGSLGDLWSFDLKNELWTLLWSCQKYSKDMSFIPYKCGPCPRHDHVAVINNKSLWIYGGMSGLEECNDLWQWNIVDSKWTKVNFKVGPVDFRYISAIKIHRYWVIYGFNESKGKPEKWKYSFRLNKWSTEFSTLSVLPPHSTFDLSTNDIFKNGNFTDFKRLNLKKNKVTPVSVPHVDDNSPTDIICLKSASTVNLLSNSFSINSDQTKDTYAYQNYDFQDHVETTFIESVDHTIMDEVSKIKNYILLLGNNIDKASFDNYISIQFSLL